MATKVTGLRKLPFGARGELIYPPESRVQCFHEKRHIALGLGYLGVITGEGSPVNFICIAPNLRELLFQRALQAIYYIPPNPSPPKGKETIKEESLRRNAEWGMVRNAMGAYMLACNKQTEREKTVFTWQKPDVRNLCVNALNQTQP